MGSFRDRIQRQNWTKDILNDVDDPNKDLKSIIDRMLSSKYGDKQYSKIKNENERQYFSYKKIGLGLYKNCIENNTIEPNIKESFKTEESLEKLIGRFASECGKSNVLTSSEVEVLPSIGSIIKQLLVEERVIRNIDYLIENNKNKNTSHDDMFAIQMQELENLKTTVAEGEIPYKVLVHFQSPYKIKKVITKNIAEWQEKEKQNTTGEIIYADEFAITMQKMIDEQNKDEIIIDI